MHSWPDRRWSQVWSTSELRCRQMSCSCRHVSSSSSSLTCSSTSSLPHAHNPHTYRAETPPPPGPPPSHRLPQGRQEDGDSVCLYILGRFLCFYIFRAEHCDSAALSGLVELVHQVQSSLVFPCWTSPPSTVPGSPVGGRGVEMEVLDSRNKAVFKELSVPWLQFGFLVFLDVNCWMTWTRTTCWTISIHRKQTQHAGSSSDHCPRSTGSLDHSSGSGTLFGCL